MRYAIVSDIHANIAAWRNVLTDIADLRTDKIICLGDILGYGPDSIAVLESVYQYVDVTLQGNHDAAICRRMSTDSFCGLAAEAVSHSRATLAPAALQWMRSLPLTHAEAGFRCAHGDFSAPQEFHYIVEPADALPSWQTVTEQLLFVGHSHIPGIFVIGASGTPHFLPPCDFELEPGKRYIVNPGSVGYPRAGAGRSSYCIYDSDSNSVIFRELPFDSAGLRQALINTGMKDDLWLRQKEMLQKLPVLRDKVDFAKPVPVTDVGQQTAPPAPRQTTARPNRNSMVTATMLGIAALAGLFAVAGFMLHGKHSAMTHHASRLIVPDFELPVIAAYPLIPPDKNLLPPLPVSTSTPERFENWRYAIDNLNEQSFQTGLRDSETTLLVRHKNRHSFFMESPLVNLDGIKLQALRMRGRLRKHAGFDGTVLYQLVTYKRGHDGEPVQHKVDPFEMRTSRRKLTPPGAERDVRIKIPQSVSHARFRIEADFTGVLELEQPYLAVEN
jgi:predicted phosphodiesterase